MNEGSYRDRVQRKRLAKIERYRVMTKWGIPIFLMLWFPLMFYESVMHYQAHSDDVSPLVIGIPCAIGCFVALRRYYWRREKGMMILYALALVSCVFFTYWMWRIPYCVECDEISRDQLGFMLKPFADKFFNP